jgi:hypothetical protein
MMFHQRGNGQEKVAQQTEINSTPPDLNPKTQYNGGHMDFITIVIEKLEGLSPEAKEEFFNFVNSLEEQENKNNKEETTK